MGPGHPKFYDENAETRKFKTVRKNAENDQAGKTQSHISVQTMEIGGKYGRHTIR